MILKDEKVADNKKCISELARQSNSSYVHTTNLIKKMEEAGFVKSEKKGREKVIRLTDEGLKAASALSEAISRISTPSVQNNQAQQKTEK